MCASPLSRVVLCDSCAPNVVNGDWSSLDYHFNNVERDDDGMTASDREMARIDAATELMPYLTPVGDADEGGYFNCGLCGGIQCGGGHTFTHEGE